MSRILIVDDELSMREFLKILLEKEGYEVTAAPDAARALQIVKQETIDLVVTDIRMPGMSGLELFRRMNRLRPAPPFVIMTAHGTVQTAVKALKEGVTDYLVKPLNYDELAIILERACRHQRMSSELAALRSRVEGDHTFHGIIGAGRRMRDIFEMVRRRPPPTRRS
jgi:DNA-binding NtrC family response regulator